MQRVTFILFVVCLPIYCLGQGLGQTLTDLSGSPISASKGSINAQGQMFLFEDYQPGVIALKGGGEISVPFMKYNLLTDKIVILKDGNPFEVSSATINTFSLYDRPKYSNAIDTLKFINLADEIPNDLADGFFYQVMFEGKFSFYQKVKVNLIKGGEGGYNTAEPMSILKRKEYYLFKDATGGFQKVKGNLTVKKVQALVPLPQSTNKKLSEKEIIDLFKSMNMQ